MSEFTFKLPDLGEGLVEAEIAEWMVQVGDLVEEEDAICAVMTDKAAVELSAPVTGKVLSIAGEPGDIIAVGAPLIVFETDKAVPVDDTTKEPAPVLEEAVQSPSAVPVAKESPTDEPTAEKPAGKVLTSPSIRHRAREANVDLTQVSATGPRGRVLMSDLDSYLADSATVTSKQGSRKALESAIKEIKVVGLRRMIAERMSEANRDIPHFAYVEEIDVTSLESLRQHLNGKKTAGEDKLTLLPFIGLALAHTLANFPQCNALYDRESNTISQHRAVHLGVATQTDSGLKVPVVRHCESLSLDELASEIRRISTAARMNTAKRDELMGSTITITSLGKHGGIVTTPIINLPEVAIIGVNKAVDRPVVMNGSVVVRKMMNLSSSFDHRFVDGFDAAMMIQALKTMLEQPATIFMDC